MKKNILSIFTILGFLTLPIIFRKQPIKDWLLIFFIKGFLSSFIGLIVVSYGFISYPKRLLPKLFQINILFDYLIFPIACVLYNQITYQTSFIPTTLIAFLFSIPMTIFEVYLVKVTGLIKYHKKWTWITTFITLTLTFWVVRLFMFFIRHYDTTTSATNLKSSQNA